SSGEVPTIIQQALRRVSTERRPVRLDESDELLLVDHPEADNMHSFLGAAIICGSTPRGWFYLLNKKGANGFTEADERLAHNLATQVAIAYENATLYAEAQTHATELSMEMAVRKQAEDERARLLIREQAA